MQRFYLSITNCTWLLIMRTYLFATLLELDNFSIFTDYIFKEKKTSLILFLYLIFIYNKRRHFLLTGLTDLSPPATVRWGRATCFSALPSSETFNQFTISFGLQPQNQFWSYGIIKDVLSANFLLILSFLPTFANTNLVVFNLYLHTVIVC